MVDERDCEEHEPRPEVRFGALLREAREQRGISLRAFARELYRSHSTLVEYERGQRLAPVDVVRAYETGLGVAEGTLLKLRRRTCAQIDAADDEQRASPSPGAHADSDEATSPKPSITVLSPDGDQLATVTLDDAAVRVGREPGNDIVLRPDPAQLVSRQHCAIEAAQRRWWVRDLDSRNHVYVERRGELARVDRAELFHGDTVCVPADAEHEAGSVAPGRHWRLIFSDPGQTQLGRATRWLQYYPASGTVWVMGGTRLPRRVEAPPKARRMLLFMLERHRDLDEPADGVMVGLAELKAILWPDDDAPHERADGAVAQVAWELRPALGDDDQKLLQTERNEGYRLVPRP